MSIKGVLPMLMALALASPAFAASNDPYFDRQWGLQKIGAEAAWAKATGAGIIIAVVDSGIDLDHEDLEAKIVPGVDYIEGDSSPNDEESHGTHVAGIAAAVTGNRKGVASVAPGAKIMPMRVLDENGACVGSCRTSDAIVEAVKRGAKVINLSLGDIDAPVFGPGFAEALEYAWSRGAIPVVAAGNSYVLSSGYEDNSALVVTATGDEDQSPDYASPVGDAKWGIAAPGGGGSLTGGPRIYSTVPDGYGNKSGTSMAAPHVAGAAAVLLSLGLTSQQTVDRLLSTAKDIGRSGRDDVFGSGRLDLSAAVAGLDGSSGGSVGGSTGGSSGSGKSTAPKGQRTSSPGAAAEPSPGEPLSVTPNPEPSSDQTQAGPPGSPTSSDLPKVLGGIGAFIAALAGAFVWWKGRV